MKKQNHYYTKTLFLLTTLFSLSSAYAQEKVDVNGHDVGSWFGTHWMWVAAAIILLILLLVLSGGNGGSRRKSTTIERDGQGHVKSVTTKETND